LLTEAASQYKLFSFANMSTKERAAIEAYYASLYALAPEADPYIMWDNLLWNFHPDDFGRARVYLLHLAEPDWHANKIPPHLVMVIKFVAHLLPRYNVVMQHADEETRLYTALGVAWLYPKRDWFEYALHTQCELEPLFQMLMKVVKRWPTHFNTIVAFWTLLRPAKTEFKATSWREMLRELANANRREAPEGLARRLCALADFSADHTEDEIEEHAYLVGLANHPDFRWRDSVIQTLTCAALGNQWPCITQRRRIRDIDCFGGV
jgi:hypothetical protein